METLSVRDYRNNLSTSFDKVDNGENVYIRRRNRIYALISIENEDLTVTPALNRRIKEVHEAYQQGKCITCSTNEELTSFLDSL